MAQFFSRFHKPDSKDTPAENTSLGFGVGGLVNGRYRLDAEIGRGGMGIIFRAYDLEQKQDVAFKVINPETANALSLNQFERETEILTRLNHPHIVALYDHGFVDNDNSLPYLVMELLQGRDLAEAGTLTIAKIMDIAKQLCEVLAYIHEQGFAYRDIKPQNILLEKQGFQYFVKLIDFGLARPLGEAYLPNESSLAGTVFYLAPELINGQPADIASDLYAFGVLLYEMITGRVPFSNIDEQTILFQHQDESVPPPSQSRGKLPQALDEIVLRLLEKNPQDRFASADDVLIALNQIVLEHLPTGNLNGTCYPGSEDEVAQINMLLASSQLVSVVGNDDSLSLAAASKLAGYFADGVWVVDIPLIDEPMMLMPTVASILGVQKENQRPLTVALLEHISEKNLLLVFKRCDHLLFACAQLADVILDHCPDVHILASSCQPLRLSKEKSYTFAK